ncbi:DUF5327 family protein [Bacillus alkalicellulosilyticus]|uniref:DUF5327 family protein n=1 Tax=Alkalihalobacterium alkalicellulosilyticum TaxID=1912214 RepID=UPI000997E2F0|nr:DUF5327 family protein [Bacillus alkalicellulosilyticus]
MKISAQTIMTKIEDELNQMKRALLQEDELKVREHARMVKGYCELLTNGDKTTDQIVIKKTSFPHEEKESSPENHNSLLDF